MSKKTADPADTGFALFYEGDGNTPALTREELLVALKGWRAGLDKGDETPTIERDGLRLTSRFVLTWADGRRLAVERDREKGRIAVEVPDRKRDYEKKVAGKLRRSFVEPRGDLLAVEVARQVGLLLKAFKPVFAAREDQQAKGRERDARDWRSCVNLAKLLVDPRGGTDHAHVVLPSEEETNDYHRAKVEFLLSRGTDGDDGPDGPASCFLQVDEGKVAFDLDGVSPAVAAAVCEALAPYVAERIDCERKKCPRKNLETASERKARRCAEHGGNES